MILFPSVIINLLAQQNSPSMGYAIVLSSGAVFAALVAQGYNIWKDTQTRKELIQKTERDEILKSLNEFFGPLKVLRSETRNIYEVFAVEAKKQARNSGDAKPYFRAIHHLCSNNQLEPHDRALLDEINLLGLRQIKLIEKYSWAVRNPSLAELFGMLGAHIRALRLASKGSLSNFPDAERVVFPLEFDGAIESEMRRLQAEYRTLSGEKKSNIEDELTCEEFGTLQYYDINAEIYYAKTAHADLSDLYEEFRIAGEGLPRGALILDAGCGVGRDTRYFIRRGYRVVSVDGSAAMTKMCNDYPFAFCEQRLLWDLPYRNTFDGVWACASLVHLCATRLKKAASTLSAALVPGGVIYFSMKSRQSATPSTDRYFYSYSQNDIESFFGHDGAGLKLLKFWQNKSSLESDQQLWDNYLYHKPKAVPSIKSSQL